MLHQPTQPLLNQGWPTLYKRTVEQWLQGAAATVGLGLQQCREVEVDSQGRMDPAQLERMVQEDLQQGFRPFFVNCTSGTTVLGAFDPIDPGLLRNLFVMHSLKFSQNVSITVWRKIFEPDLTDRRRLLALLVVAAC